ncbi:hypothetical protein SS1G_13134 [Sclerotinia sclerotiorum 1980 UF-70]|uniref:Cytochrome P450 n=1 Tax=Sclerotinia sclerotiorum (strain ATCC 18683 / 1980 / Ss-1) TaxID=665079 RepID=A7F6A5_SCLS1|nr:hypothetical protein SS1G_13134 [Sclerotinia sclerotiorum 1980 UF-70]EDN98276.1 hypothetical protein SS1G_13134 [Sclerotinia sclerotiorum 1980 UF-70]
MSNSCIIAAAAGAFFHNIYKSDNENLASRQGQKLAFKLVSMVVVSLWTNILVYRAFFHPLRHFPGPFGARLSKFWSLGKVMQSKFRWYQVLGDLKEEYGDYVRTALTDYGPRIEEFTTLFLSRLSKSVATQVVINDLCIYYSYDVISALAFGIFTQFLDGTQTAEVKNILDNIQSGIVAIGLLVHVPWVLTILETLSVLGGPMKEFNDWSACQVEARRHMQNPKPDIMGHLIEHTENTSSGRALLNADSRVIIGAGSDTTASTLSVLFIILANYPHYQAQLHKELTSIFKDEKYSNLRTSPLLDGIIQEALRLYPSVTFTSQRVIPKDGLSIGTVYIPGDTVVSIATWQIQRDHRNFKDPTQFIPERWTTRPELVLNKSAYLPFSMGAYSCIGKGLAMMELRSVIARTILEYEVLFPENTKFDEKAFFNEIKDHFTSGVPKCELVFKRR